MWFYYNVWCFKPKYDLQEKCIQYSASVSVYRMRLTFIMAHLVYVNSQIFYPVSSFVLYALFKRSSILAEISLQRFQHRVVALGWLMNLYNLENRGKKLTLHWRNVSSSSLL